MELVESISELLSIINPGNGQTVYVKSYYSGQNRGGGHFIYDSEKAQQNNGIVVINGWVRQLNDYIDFSMLSIERDGNVPVDDKIIKAFAASKNYRKPLRNFSGIYYLDGAEPVSIGFDYDLTGTIFKLGPNFSGGFEIDREIKTTTYDNTSEIVALLKTQGNLSGNATTSLY